MTTPARFSPGQLQLEHDAFGRLTMIRDAERVADVFPVRAFPVSDPDHWISICDTDGREILRIEKLADLPTDVRRVLEEELARREFIPVIQQIHAATHEEPSQWEVETDRGPTSFTLNSEDDVRRIEPHQASIVDAHGIRYLIPDVGRLDGASRRLLDHFL
jgi:hypothetical protein